MRVGITGASGFVGSALSTYLEKSGIGVVRLRRSESPETAGQLCEADIDRQLSSVGALSAIVHLAGAAHRISRADTSGVNFSLANADGALAVARAARRHAIGRFVFLSSVGVHGYTSGDGVIDEYSKLAPYDPYTRSKAQGEALVRDELAGSETEFSIVRVPMVIGLGAPGNWTRLQRLVESGWPLPFGSLNAARSYIGVGNLCALIRASISSPMVIGRSLVAADSPPLSIAKILELVASAKGRRATIFRVPPSILRYGLKLIGRSREWTRIGLPLVVSSHWVDTLLKEEDRNPIIEEIVRASGG